MIVEFSLYGVATVQIESSTALVELSAEQTEQALPGLLRNSRATIWLDRRKRPNEPIVWQTKAPDRLALTFPEKYPSGRYIFIPVWVVHDGKLHAFSATAGANLLDKQLEDREWEFGRYNVRIPQVPEGSKLFIFNEDNCVLVQ